MIVKSIRWRLQLWHGVILFTVLAGFGFTVYRLQHANELRRVDQELQQRLGPVLEALRRGQPGERGGPGRPGEPRPEGETDILRRPGPRPREGVGEFPLPREFRLGPNRGLLFEGDTNAFYYVVWLRDGQELSRSISAPEDVPRPERLRSMGPAPTMRMRGTMRELYQFTPPGECLLVGRSIAPEQASLHRFAIVLSGLGGAVLVLGLAGGWWLASRAIRPIGDISAAAVRIANGDLSHRINAADADNELGQLAGVLNSTFTRLEAAFRRQEQFTADASHELRTPITVVLNQTQSALARERSAPEYREALEACQRSAKRMRQLTDSLLLLARLDSAQELPTRVRFDLAQTARECIELIRPLLAERGQSIHMELAPAECCGDPEQLSAVITNLLTNAIQYNRDRGEVRITTRTENNGAILTVTDQGPGVAPDSLEKIFVRFYRVDESRNRHTGGVGLGLAIVKSCVEAAGGSVTCSNVQPNGLKMVVRLPAALPEASSGCPK